MLTEPILYSSILFNLQMLLAKLASSKAFKVTKAYLGRSLPIPLSVMLRTLLLSLHASPLFKPIPHV
jgi:hypothetical protein